MPQIPTLQFTVRLPEQDARDFRRHAEACGTTVHALLRQMVTERLAIPPRR